MLKKLLSLFRIEFKYMYVWFIGKDERCYGLVNFVREKIIENVKGFRKGDFF